MIMNESVPSTQTDIITHEQIGNFLIVQWNPIFIVLCYCSPAPPSPPLPQYMCSKSVFVVGVSWSWSNLNLQYWLKIYSICRISMLWVQVWLHSSKHRYEYFSLHAVLYYSAKCRPLVLLSTSVDSLQVCVLQCCTENWNVEKIWKTKESNQMGEYANPLNNVFFFHYFHK